MFPALCPKCATPRMLTPAGPAIRCENCGLVYSKWIDAQSGRVPAHRDGHDGEDAEGSEGGRSGPLGALISAITDAPPPMSQGARIGHALLLTCLFIYSWKFILGDVASGEAWNNFLHGVNLVFHEAGHVFMMPFGQFIHVLGGTLGQLVMPLVVCGAFLVTRRDAAGASVGLWWFGQSLTDCAPYIADARKLQLPLLGGGTGAERSGHDWQYLLGATGLSAHDVTLGYLAQLAGSAAMLAAVGWGGWTVWRARPADQA